LLKNKKWDVVAQRVRFGNIKPCVQITPAPKAKKVCFVVCSSSRYLIGGMGRRDRLKICSFFKGVGSIPILNTLIIKSVSCLRSTVLFYFLKY